MRVNCAIAGKQSEDPAGGFPFGSSDLERYRIRRNLHPIGQLIVGKEFSFNGTPNRPELGQGSESDIAPDPRRPASPFPKIPRRLYPLCVPCVIIKETHAPFSSR